MSESQVSEGQLTVAQVTLWALMTSVGSEPGLVPVVLLPRPIAVAVVDVLTAMARMAKPVLCVGVPLTGAVGIACWPLDTGRNQRRDAMMLDFAQFAGGGLAIRTRGSQVASDLIPARVFDEWQRQYDMPQIAVSILPPTKNEAAKGALAAVKFAQNSVKAVETRWSPPWR